MPRSPHERLNLRLPPDLHAKIVEAAENNSPPQSMTAEIIERLYESFRPKRQMLTIEEADARHEAAADAWLLSMRETREHYERQNRELAQRIAELEAERSK